MKGEACVLTEEMIAVVIEVLADCFQRSNGGLKIMAAAIEPTHMHLLLPNTGRDIEITAKWLADQTTKAIHRRTSNSGPVWTSKPWCEHIDDHEHWEALLRYIDDHNVRAGRRSRPYPFLCEIET
jgi:REP element-mobilizing transposase RayT